MSASFVCHRGNPASSWTGDFWLKSLSLMLAYLYPFLVLCWIFIESTLHNGGVSRWGGSVPVTVGINDRWHITNDMRHTTCDTLHVTFDMWHLIFSSSSVFIFFLMHKYFPIKVYSPSNTQRFQGNALLAARLLPRKLQNWVSGKFKSQRTPVIFWHNDCSFISPNFHYLF